MAARSALASASVRPNGLTAEPELSSLLVATSRARTAPSPLVNSITTRHRIALSPDCPPPAKAYHPQVLDGLLRNSRSVACGSSGRAAVTVVRSGWRTALPQSRQTRPRSGSPAAGHRKRGQENSAVPTTSPASPLTIPLPTQCRPNLTRLFGDKRIVHPRFRQRAVKGPCEGITDNLQACATLFSDRFSVRSDRSAKLPRRQTTMARRPPSSVHSDGAIGRHWSQRRPEMPTIAPLGTALAAVPLGIARHAIEH